jgi:hypothetical protein
MGTGLVMNVVTKSGGNTFKGSVAYAYQPLEWNDNNAANCTPFSVGFGGNTAVSCDPAIAGRGTPTTSLVKQFDASIGGPIKKDQIWFFGAIRKARSEAGISRTPVEVQRIQSFAPNAKLFNNYQDSWQPYAKITARLNSRHEFQAFYQRDRLTLSGDREYNYEPVLVNGTGGSLYGAKLQSVWGKSITTTFHGLLQRQERQRSEHVRADARHGSADRDPQLRQPAGRRAPGQRPHPGRRQRAVVQPAARLPDHRSRRPHLVQGGLGRHARVPDGLLRGAAQPLRPPDAIRQRRFRPRGAASARPPTTPAPARSRSGASTRARST